MKKVERDSVDYDPFTIITHDKAYFIAMPKNFGDLIESDGFRELAALIESSEFKMIQVEKEIKIVPSKDVATYFRGLYNRMFKDDWKVTEDTFKPCSTKPAGRGRATFDLYVLKKASGIMNLENYLGESARSGAGNSHLTHYLSTLGGASGVRTFGKVDQVIKNLMASRYELYQKKLYEIAQQYKLELSQVTKDYKKTKQYKTKNSRQPTRTVVISPSKISTTPYVFTNEEKIAFEKQELCFKEVEKINTSYKNGVQLSDFTEVQEKYSENIRLCWDYCSKYSKLKSARLKSMKEVLQLGKKQADEFSISKNAVTQMWNNFGYYVKKVYSSGDEKDLDPVLYALSSVLVDKNINNRGITAKNIVAQALSIRRTYSSGEHSSACDLYDHIRLLTGDVILNVAPTRPVLSTRVARRPGTEIGPDDKFEGEYPDYSDSKSNGNPYDPLTENQEDE
jgi:hypothetical protein